MEDKSFELLTQMYADFTSQFKDIKDDINTLKSSASKIEAKVSKIEVKLENDTDRKLDILLEARGETNKRLDIIENKLDNISAKV